MNTVGAAFRPAVPDWIWSVFYRIAKSARCNERPLFEIQCARNFLLGDIAIIEGLPKFVLHFIE